MSDTAQRAAEFLALHRQPGSFILPNPWDVGSARLLARSGFKALASTSAGLAFSRGLPDNAVPEGVLMAHLRELVGATPLPVSADLENGFGRTPKDVQRTVREALSTGIVGFSIEDTASGLPRRQMDLAQARERVLAAVETARALPYPVVVTARAENYFIGRPDLPDVIRRLQCYQEAGADVLYAPGLLDVDELKSLLQSVDRPVNVMLGGQPSPLALHNLASMGVKRVSVGGSLARLAYGALLQAAAEMASAGTFDYAKLPMSRVQLNRIFLQP